MQLHVRTLEQGLALDELVEMKTSIECEVQRESGGDQSPPTAGAARRASVPPSSELSDQGVAARKEGGIPAEARKYGSDGSIIVGTLAVRSGRGILSRTAWPCALRDSSSCSKSRRTQMWE